MPEGAAEGQQPFRKEQPEGVEQQVEKTVQALQANLEQVADFNPAKPLNEEQKGKVDKLNEWLQKPGNDAIGAAVFLTPIGAVAAEAWNLFAGKGFAPGELAAYTMALGASGAIALKTSLVATHGYERMKTGFNNLGNYIDNKLSPAEKK